MWRALQVVRFAAGHPIVVLETNTRLPRRGEHAKVQKEVALLITIEPNGRLAAERHHDGRFEVEIAANDGEYVTAHPIKSSLHLLSSIPAILLEPPQLLQRVGARICLGMMLTAECDHPRRVMMLPLVPRRIEVMPVQIGTPAAGNRTPKSNFAPELPAHVNRRRSIHHLKLWRITH
jgi:hypothetical protein